MTLSEWLDKWLENMADTLRPNALRNYRSYIENHIKPGLGDKQLARITPKDVQQFNEKLSDSLASGTVRRIHTTLHGALKDEVAGTLKVCRTVYRETGGGLTAGDTKTYAGTRRIVLPASTVQVLHERKKSALTEWIFPNPLKPEQPTNPGSAYRRLKVLLKRAGLPNIRFHDKSHPYALNFFWGIMGYLEPSIQ